MEFTIKIAFHRINLYHDSLYVEDILQDLPIKDKLIGEPLTARMDNTYLDFKINEQDLLNLTNYIINGNYRNYIHDIKIIL